MKITLKSIARAYRKFLILTMCWYYGGFWMRFCGYGIAVKNTNKVPLLFSERMNFDKHIKIGRWRIKWLSKN